MQSSSNGVAAAALAGDLPSLQVAQVATRRELAIIPIGGNNKVIPLMAWHRNVPTRGYDLRHHMGWVGRIGWWRSR